MQYFDLTTRQLVTKDFVLHTWVPLGGNSRAAKVIELRHLLPDLLRMVIAEKFCISSGNRSIYLPSVIWHVCQRRHHELLTCQQRHTIVLASRHRSSTVSQILMVRLGLYNVSLQETISGLGVHEGSSAVEKLIWLLTCTGTTATTMASLEVAITPSAITYYLVRESYSTSS